MKREQIKIGEFNGESIPASKKSKVAQIDEEMARLDHREERFELETERNRLTTELKDKKDQLIIGKFLEGETEDNVKRAVLELEEKIMMLREKEYGLASIEQGTIEFYEKLRKRRNKLINSPKY